MENEMILKEISKILDRVNEEDKKEILNSSRRVLDSSMGHDASKVDATLWKRSEQEFENLDNEIYQTRREGNHDKTRENGTCRRYR